jgi:hypothetical protein
MCVSSMNIHSSKICQMHSLTKSAIGFYWEELFTDIQVGQTLTLRLLRLVLVNIQILLQQLNISSVLSNVVPFGCVRNL